LENTLTGNLDWTIEHFAHCAKGSLTFPTKFQQVDSLLALPHRGRIIVRMSVNPEEIVRRIEIGTSPLQGRIDALNRLTDAGYKTGLLIAPVVLLQGWQDMYHRLLQILHDSLTSRTKKGLPVEIIFMTYSYVHRMINRDAFPAAPELYDPQQMTVRGRGRYCYRPDEREEGARILREYTQKYLPEAEIKYIV
jgi:spore photoproduct lyase